MPRLILRDISRQYDGATPVQALRGVSLTIEQGEFVSIEGPSGGGKSTLLNIIGLLDEPTAGDYRVGEIDTGSSRDEQLAKIRSDRFAFIFQSFHLLDRRPVIDSVELALVYRAVPRYQRHLLATEALANVGLAHLAGQLSNKLSGGERQRVAIARALATGAPIVVADEPTGNLDSENSKAIVESLQALHKSGATVVLVTHSPEVAATARRSIRIRDGRLTESFHERGESKQGVFSETSVTEPALPAGQASKLLFRDLLRDANASLRSRMGRAAGLIAAVAVGVALAVGTLGIAVSASAQVSDTFNAHTNRDVTVEWLPEDVAGQEPAAMSSVVERLEQVQGIHSVGLLENYGQHELQASPVRPAFQISTHAITRGVPSAARLEVVWAPGHSESLNAGDVLIGANLAAQLDLGPLAAGPVVLLDDRSVTVVGIIETSPRIPELLGSVVTPVVDAGFLGYLSQTQAILLTQAGAAQQVARQAPLVINPFTPTRLAVDAPVDPTTLRAQVESDLQATLLALTGIAMLASVVGLANAMVLSVIERKQEIGLRRALGARRHHIVALVLAESTIIGGIGGIVGFIAGLAGILAATIIRHWSPIFDFRLAPIAVLGGIVVGAAGGALASIRASHIQPNDALRL